MEMLPVKELTISPSGGAHSSPRRSSRTIFGPGFGAHQSKGSHRIDIHRAFMSRSADYLAKVRILLAESEARVAGFIAKGLREAAYAVDIACDGEEALHWGVVNDYDLIILDTWLPVKDGQAVCRALRMSGFRAPVLMLTALDAMDDQVRGLECGADDYLTMPCDFKELLGRLRALLQRRSAPRSLVAWVADLRLDTSKHTVERAGKPVSLTSKEYALLEFLVLNEGRVVGREQIARYVWDDTLDPFSDVIDVYVKRLRGKMDTGYSRPLIHIRQGEGFILTGEKVPGGV